MGKRKYAIGVFAQSFLIMSTHPTSQRLLSQAHEDGQWYAYQPEAIGLCFEALTLEPIGTKPKSSSIN